MQIAVIDLGVGNLRSVEQALCAVAPKANVVLTHEPRVIADADKVVLPGQGAIGTWFHALKDRELETVLHNAIKEKPLLGICVGMQAMFDSCEEDGGTDGLGLFAGSVRHFRHFHSGVERLKIPQMGWNQVSKVAEHALWQGIAEQSYFYFVHSYCANLPTGTDQSVVYGYADYGHQFVAAVGKDNVFAVQFHPEKSHDDGLRLLKNFTEWSGAE